MNACGILNLDKPAGLTSRDAVNRAERLVRPAKCGHAGTLDPLATGVLVVCVGPATRLIQYVQRMEKLYRATFLLGRWSASDDVEGEVEILAEQPRPAEGVVRAAMRQFVGQIEQRPPAHSAIKVGGQRAYKLARRGEALELPARPVTIHALELVRYKYPELVVDVRCGSGTYVRSLGRDLAESLGTAAVMAALERSAIGGFRIEASVPVDALREEIWQQHLQPALTAVADLPRVTLNDTQLTEIRHGRPISIPTVNSPTVNSPTGNSPTGNSPTGNSPTGKSPTGKSPTGIAAGSAGDEPTAPPGAEWAAVDEAGNLVAIVHEKRPGELWPRSNLM